MELKEGMYARTEEGTIFKVSSVNEIDVDGIWYKALMGDNVFKNILINPPFKFEIIEKASNNIIDLIEVGDYVNGSKVLWFMYDTEKSIKEGIDEKIGVEVEGKWDTIEYLTKDIKSIVTKEQFESMSYKL